MIILQADIAIEVVVYIPISIARNCDNSEFKSEEESYDNWFKRKGLESNQ